VTITFRPALLPQDVPLLAEIFVNSVVELGEDDYGEEELAAWVSVADDEDAFAVHLKPILTLIAFVDGEPAGFVSLKGTDVIHMLYVAPDHARKGVGTAMAQAIETLAHRRGAKVMHVDASDLAEPLFKKLGYEAQRRNTVDLGGVWLANTTMTKTLPANETVQSVKQ
jgi:putative acetyltransferase